VVKERHNYSAFVV